VLKGTLIWFGIPLAATNIKDQKSLPTDSEPVLTVVDELSMSFPSVSRGASMSILTKSAGVLLILSIVPAQCQPLIYSSFIGSENHDNGHRLCPDAGTGIWLVGVTAGTQFPTTEGAFDRTYTNNSDASQDVDVFIVHFGQAANTLLYGTYIGGGEEEWPNAMVSDGNGGVWISGKTCSLNNNYRTPFPTTRNAAYGAYQGGGSDAFLIHFNGAGQVPYSTFFGSNDLDDSFALLPDGSGGVWMGGGTRKPASNSNFPTTNDAFDRSHNGDWDGFLTHFDQNGRMLYSTFIGGRGADRVTGIASSGDGDLWISISTNSQDFPTTENAADRSISASDAAICKFSRDNRLLYSTFWGGSSEENAIGITPDGSEGIWFVGATTSTEDFPTTEEAVQREFGGGSADAYIAHLDRNGRIQYSSFWGGDGSDEVHGLSPNQAGGLVITGWTTSDNFPVTENAQRPESEDVFMSHFGYDGSSLFSTLLGGDRADYGYDVLYSDHENIWLTGIAGGRGNQSSFPTTDGAFDRTFGGYDWDGFLSRYSIEVPPDNQVVEAGINRPAVAQLAYAYPNPFNSQLTVGFNLTRKSIVQLKLYDQSGRVVCEMLNSRPFPPGRFMFPFDAGKLPAGSYLLRMQTPFDDQSRLLNLVK